MIPSLQSNLSDELLLRLRTLITERTGIRTTDHDSSALVKAVQERARALNLSEHRDYLRLLSDDFQNRGEEWRRIVLRITNGESYFFRDQGQMALLRDTILPELIGRRRGERTLRIWSAGCSTGEEPYSLAILLAELLPDLYDWRIKLLGTDINPEFLERARRGAFGGWSFRMVAPELRDKYFHERKGVWELNPEIRSLVSFERFNLLRDEMPVHQAGWQGFDLILCRNVFIYFDRPAVAHALRGFVSALDPNGVLMTGHSELAGVSLDGLVTVRHPESILYRRSAQSAPAPVASTSSTAMPERRPASSVTASIPAVGRVVLPPIAVPATPKPAPAASKPVHAPASSSPESQEIVKAFIREAEGLLRNGKYSEVIGRGEPLIERFPDVAALRSLVGSAYANRGEYRRAEEHCRAALDASSFEVIPYHILAQIAEERGDRAEAKSLLRKVLYLAPSSVAAYLHLADIHDTEGDASRARNDRSTALEILRSTDRKTILPMLEEFTVEELVEHLTGLLEGPYISH